jgi:glycosyltransferase involved in cell wall biosynthesis
MEEGRWKMENGRWKMVSIVVPAYNSSRTIRSCIEACLNQDYPELEVIVVDDGSTDGMGEIVRGYPVRYIRKPNGGPASARNVGWRAAIGEIVCFTDADCIPVRDWVSRLVSGYTSDEVAAVGGSYEIVNPDSLLATCIHEEIIQRHLSMPREVDYLGSFNLSLRKRVLEEVGGFDEGYRKASGEDNDLSYRLSKLGYKLIFDSEAKVAHHHPERLWPYLLHQFRHGYWRMKLYREHPYMAKGDVYSGISDLIQPPLFLATMGLLPFAFKSPIGGILLALLSIGVILQLPNAIRIVKRKGKIRHLALVPIALLRGYARGLGMLFGFWRFFV